MKRNIIYLFTLSLILFSASCTDFLDKQPASSVSSDEAIITLEDAESALVGVYSSMKGASYYGQSYTVMPDMATDEVLSVIGYSNQLGTFYKMDYTPGDPDVTEMWAAPYRTIIRSSNIINALETIAEDPEDADRKGQVKGEALMARALAHFDLVKAFAPAYNAATAGTDLGVPVITKYEGKIEPARNTVQEVYNQVITDATAAKSLMKYQGTDDGTFTPAAADALLARVYLYMKDYTKAIEYSTNVIDDYSYELATPDNYNDLWLNDTGNEIIWKVTYTATDMSGNPGYNYYNDAQGGGPKPDYIPADWIINLYDQTSDVRYNSFFINQKTAFGWTDVLVNKYPQNPLFSEEGCNMIKAFRLSEQYLIRAEAYSETNQDALALADLNTLRAKRITKYVDDTSLSLNTLKTAIWNERQKELAFEGHRFWDLKRKGLGFTRSPKANTNPVYNEITIEATNHHWVLPIPQDEINGNANMVQNPKY